MLLRYIEMVGKIAKYACHTFRLGADSSLLMINIVFECALQINSAPVTSRHLNTVSWKKKSNV